MVSISYVRPNNLIPLRVRAVWLLLVSYEPCICILVVWQDLSMSEEDQMMRAIAMSLGQDIPMDQRAESPEVKQQTVTSMKDH